MSGPDGFTFTPVVNNHDVGLQHKTHYKIAPQYSRPPAQLAPKQNILGHIPDAEDCPNGPLQKRKKPIDNRTRRGSSHAYKRPFPLCTSLPSSSEYAET
jgi:hypothetical protein